MLTTQTLIEKVKTTPEQITFQETIAVIENEYDFTPTHFNNGEQKNSADENNGSCKILGFASIHKLTEEQTLQLFGDYYRVDVLQNTNGEDHQNIRQFIKHGWSGVVFSSMPLSLKR